MQARDMKKKLRLRSVETFDSRVWERKNLESIVYIANTHVETFLFLHIHMNSVSKQLLAKLWRYTIWILLSDT